MSKRVHKHHFAKNFRKLRKGLGISMQKAGDDLCLTQKKIASYETGYAHPNYDQLIIIADYFKITIDQLLKTEL